MTRSYDTAGRATRILTGTAGSVLSTLNYGYGSAQGSYSASPAGLLTATPAGDALAYNTAQQLTSLTPAAGPGTTFAYDGNGARTTATRAPSGATPAAATGYGYTPAGALSTVTLPFAAPIGYTVDGENLRQSRTTAAGTNQMLWSTTGGLPLLLDDGGHSYIYGPATTPIAQIDTTSNTVEYLHTDLLGTPKTITSSTGAVTGRATFDEFGTPTGTTGTARTAIGYTGNWTDPDTGLVYLRARDYDPGTRQFLTVDPALEITDQPYAYVANDPLTNIDPTGMWGEEIWANVGSFALGVIVGAADAVTFGGASLALNAFVPGFECFAENNPFYGAGNITGQIVVGVAMIAAGGSGLAVLAATAVRMGAKEVIKTAARAATSAVIKSVKSVATSIKTSLGRANAPAPTNLRHYTTDAAAEAIGKSGAIEPSLASGKTWLTLDKFTDGATAQAKLALNKKPDGYFEIPASRINSPSAPSAVGPPNNQPGGGTEITTAFAIDVVGLHFIGLGG